MIKPAVSASGFETYALEFPIDSSARETIARVVSAGDVLVQPFAEEIPRDGEISFMFIDGEYSHATIKRAAAGRVPRANGAWRQRRSASRRPRT